MEIFLHKVNGCPAEMKVEICRCGPEQAEDFYALQNEVRAAMPCPEQFVPDELEQIRSYLSRDLGLGVWQGERLGAYFILRYCGMEPDNYARFMGLPPDQWPQWANADSAVVHPDWRGNGLQRILLHTALEHLRPGIRGIGATVSPENLYSLNNALAEGFEVVCRRPMYGGFDRFLLRKLL